MTKTKAKTMTTKDQHQLDSSTFAPQSNLDCKVEVEEQGEPDENSECRQICSPPNVKKPKISNVDGLCTPCLLPSPNQFQPQTLSSHGFCPPGYPIQGPHQMGSLNNICQVPSSNEPVTASTNPSQIPGSFCQFGNAHPHPPYPAGPWDPSSWWGQMQRFLCSSAFPFPGPCNYFPPPAPQPTPNWPAAAGESSQQEMPSANVFQSLPCPEESQSAVNAQLWAAIHGLYANLADIRNRLPKFKTGDNILKLEGKQLAADSTGNTSTLQGAKREISKKLVASSDDPHPSPQGSSIVKCVEAVESELIGTSVDNLEEAFELYNKYSFKVGFGVRKNRTRLFSDPRLGARGQEFCCCKEGKKRCKDTQNKCYTKTNTRTDCKAMVYFKRDVKKGVWNCTEHVMEHNHEFVPLEQRHLIRSHKKLKIKRPDT